METLNLNKNSKIFLAIKELIYDKNKHKKAKSLLFDWIDSITGIRPGRMKGRGESLPNIIETYKANKNGIGLHQEEAEELVQAITLAVELCMYDNSDNKPCYKQALNMLESVKEFITVVSEETGIEYFNHLLTLKMYNGKSIMWDDLPDYIKSNDV
ncbi:MAG: hypothetical protein ACOCV8_05665, partial [Spirochaetota bacterium]